MNQHKMEKKVKRSVAMLKKHLPSVLLSPTPTPCVYVGNSGCVCGVGVEELEGVLGAVGEVDALYSFLNKPFTFVRYTSVHHAQNAVEQLQGQRPPQLGPQAPNFYLAFVVEVPETESEWPNSLPQGLKLFENFVTEDEEEQLWNIFNRKCQETKTSGDSLKNRAVLHYGHNFIYGKNVVETERKADEPFPEECGGMVERMMGLDFSPHCPDQLTVNIYQPGQGIPPHIDTHSTCQDYVSSLSLLSDVVMEFSNPCSGEKIPVLLPRRSLLVLTGESRYAWRHGQMSNTTKVNSKDRACMFLFSLAFPQLCDWNRAESKIVDHVLPSTSSEAAQLEKTYVAQVYENIADHFDCTRHSLWPGVRHFLSQLDSGSTLLDVGCGNGKYLIPYDGLVKIGCDLSSCLCAISRSKGANCVVSSCLQLPFLSHSFDASISIAVFHHLATHERRRDAIKEQVRILKPGGVALIYVWAFEQRRNKENSAYLNKEEDGDKREGGNLCEEAEEGKLGVHTNRTQFKQQDLLVPWDKAKRPATAAQETSDTTRYLRYYHVFKEGELEELCTLIPSAKVEKSYYEQGNWCVVLKKV